MEAESNMEKQPSEHKARQFSELSSCCRIWEFLSVLRCSRIRVAKCRLVLSMYITGTAACAKKLAYRLHEIVVIWVPYLSN